ncbi:MAG: hypothetical protein JO053_10720 [Acidobacteria bacterium]|nr:hypothetical protein [Acidobacteriota bacterium]
MNFTRSIAVKALLSLSLAAAFSLAAYGQGSSLPPIVMKPKAPMPVAVGNNLYCAGYIQTGGISTTNKIVAGQDEADGFHFSQNDYMYINMGRDKGVNVGDIFAVVRPRGRVDSKWTDKKVGNYVQELGALEVVSVKQNVSAVRIKSSCDDFLLGDLVQLVERRQSPLYEQRPPLDIFGDPSGKATGRILMARDGAETLARDFIAYVDLGTDEHVRVGDRMTIFRDIKRGNVMLEPQHEDITSKDYGFHSDAFSGGTFSNQSTRKTGENADKRETNTYKVRKDRPSGLRKVVGEAVVLNVKERTATIVITRNAQEIHTGDWVEIQ